MFDYQYDPAVLIAELGYGGLSPAEQTAVLEKIDALLSDRVGIRVEMALSLEELEAFNALGSADEARRFVQEHVPDIADIYDQEFAGIVRQLKIA